MLTTSKLAGLGLAVPTRAVRSQTAFGAATGPVRPPPTAGRPPCLAEIAVPPTPTETGDGLSPRPSLVPPAKAVPPPTSGGVVVPSAEPPTVTARPKVEDGVAVATTLRHVSPVKPPARLSTVLAGEAETVGLATGESVTVRPATTGTVFRPTTVMNTGLNGTFGDLLVPPSVTGLLSWGRRPPIRLSKATPRRGRVAVVADAFAVPC